MLSTFNSTVRENVELRSANMRRQVWYQVPYNDLINFANRLPTEAKVKAVAPKGDLLDMKDAKPNELPIQIYEDFSGKDGGSSMQILTKMTIKPRPVLGDDTLLLKGARQSFVYTSLHVNQVRQAVNTKAGEFNEQVIKKYVQDLLGQAEPQLTDWFARYIGNSGIKRAILEGKGHELTSALPFGRGLSKISHPNFLVAGNGYVSYGGGKPGTAGYESAVASALDGMTSANTMSLPLLLEWSTFAAREKRLVPCIKTEYGEYFLCMITPAQHWQLQQDPLWEKIATKVLPFSQKNERANWLLNGRVGYYQNIVFRVDVLGWGAHTNANPNWVSKAGSYGTTTPPSPTAGTVVYGCYDSGTGDFPDIYGVDDSPFQLATILGAGAVNGGIAKKLSFTAEEVDHANVKEVGAKQMYGFERHDLFDSDAQIAGNSAGDFVENTGSIVLATYSPVG